jgi:hypothetical protein
VIADEAVVSDVRISHDEAVAADSRDSAALSGSAVDGDVLADVVMVTDLEARFLAFGAEVLWGGSGRGEREEAVMAA